MMRPRLEKISIAGYKTIKRLDSFEPRALTVLIGPNGAGKSNLISFFRLLSWSMSAPGQLQRFVAAQGGASAILHDGASRTREIEFTLKLKTDQGQNDYHARLFYGAGDVLVYADESFRFLPDGEDGPPSALGVGQRESGLIDRAETGNVTAKTILGMLRRIIVHQFHNTSDSARFKTKWDADDGRRLKEDAGNLAPFLLRLKSDEPDYYRRITDTIRSILPFFADFELLADEYGKILLRWRENGSDVVFNASQASDGMLRILALVALLQQPERDLPDVLILDEPELGLHPFAVEVLAGLIVSASSSTQIIVATQSAALVNQFDPENIVVVERSERASTYRRLDEAKLETWLENYSLSELWEKNVLGGRP
jgi:predicted ATPase